MSAARRNTASRPGKASGLAEAAPTVRRDLPAGEIRAHVLGELHAVWRKYLDVAGACARKPKRGRVHRTRRYARELVVRIDLLDALDDDRALGKARREIKRVLKALGPVRDDDVHLKLLDELHPLSPSVSDFVKEIGRRREKAGEKAAKALGKSDLTRKLRHALRRLSPSPTADHPKRLDAFLIAALARARRRRPPQPVAGDRLHKARAALRTYRYALRALGPVLPPSHRESALHDEQGLLGDIHDWDVLFGRWKLWAAERPVRKADVKVVAAALRARREGLLEKVKW